MRDRGQAEDRQRTDRGRTEDGQRTRTGVGAQLSAHFPARTSVREPLTQRFRFGFSF